MTSWAASGIPSDVALFMAQNSFYESTPRYFETYLKLTGGKYPIVFRDAETREAVLTYKRDEPLGAGVAFEIRVGEVVVSRTLADGTEIPAGAVVHGGLLFAPENGAVHPITNAAAWRVWDKAVT